MAAHRAGLPTRKLAYLLKVVVLLGVLVSVLSFLEVWGGGRRGSAAETPARFARREAELYEALVREDERRIVPGLGDKGDAVHLSGQEAKLGEESEKKLAMNVYLSDRISYNRTLRDYRNPACKRVSYDAQLPSVSVIVIFHNEPYSVVVRTIWSVLNSALRTNPWFKRNARTIGYPGQDPTSPYVYLKEIILVDDNSTLPELKGKLDYYIETRLPKDMIRMLRLDERIGLTRARHQGAKIATGDVILFLDSHCEVDRDWLRPLLQRISVSPTTVVIPIIDVIDSSTFYYSTQDDTVFQVGGFNFAGHFTWIDVPEWEKKRRGSDISPTWSPTMAGGLFAINRNYYWEIGAYDEQMNGWGGENLEMSFRVWQCGGTLETIPCSRVGHVFRSFHPYGLPGNSDTHGINTARMAEVWMDEYAELYYLNRPDLRNNPVIGDVTHRKILREKLQCKSFQWYLDNIYRDKFVPVKDVYGYGRFSNPLTGLCIDNMQKDDNLAPLGVYGCHSTLLASQYFALSHAGQLRSEEKCAEIRYTREDKNVDENTARQVLMTSCHGKKREQFWKQLPTSQIVNVQSKLCLDAGGLQSGDELRARRCDEDRASQHWKVDYSERDNFRGRDGSHISDQQKKLEIIRKGGYVAGKRRIARSIPSPHLAEGNHTRRSQDAQRKYNSPRGKPKKKVKNKFILKLTRTLPDKTEDHLEVDIHCKHRQLFPNNSFVRELVTVLNNNDIKVINNGRLFEKNKVTKLKSEKRNKKPEKQWKAIRNETKTNDYHNKKSRFSKKTNARPIGHGYKSDKPYTDDVSDLSKKTDYRDKPRKLKKRRKLKKLLSENEIPRKQQTSDGETTDMDRDKTDSDRPRTDGESVRENGDRSAETDRSKEGGFHEQMSDREGWRVGESRFRVAGRGQGREQGRAQGRRRMNSSAHDEKMVKLILKSNLTFNFGNEFFEHYRRKNGRPDLFVQDENNRSTVKTVDAEIAPVAYTQPPVEVRENVTDLRRRDGEDEAPALQEEDLQPLVDVHVNSISSHRHDSDSEREQPDEPRERHKPVSGDERGDRVDYPDDSGKYRSERLYDDGFHRVEANATSQESRSPEAADGQARGSAERQRGSDNSAASPEGRTRSEGGSSEESLDMRIDGGSGGSAERRGAADASESRGR